MMNGNAMERLNNLIKEKNSRICAELEINDESIPESFKRKFTSETMSDEILYEYYVVYLQAIADIVPAVKISMKKKGTEKVYWHIIEAAKEMGLFVIGEINQEDIKYIIDNEMKLIIENYALDGLIISMDLMSEVLNNIAQFLKLLKDNGKGAFINVRRTHNDKPKKRRSIIIDKIKRKREPSLYELFFQLQSKIDLNYEEDSYSMVGIAALCPEHLNIANMDTFIIICNYEEEQINEIVNAFDGDELGALITVDLRNSYEKDCWKNFYSDETWAEATRSEAIRQREKVNNAIDNFKSCSM